MACNFLPSPHHTLLLTMLSSCYKSWLHTLYWLHTSFLEDLPFISMHLIIIFFKYAAAVNSWFLILVSVPSCSTVRVCNGYLSFWTCFIKVITTLNMEREISSLFQSSCPDIMVCNYNWALSPQQSFKSTINLDILPFYKKNLQHQFAKDFSTPSIPLGQATNHFLNPSITKQKSQVY